MSIMGVNNGVLWILLVAGFVGKPVLVRSTLEKSFPSDKEVNKSSIFDN